MPRRPRRGRGSPAGARRCDRDLRPRPAARGGNHRRAVDPRAGLFVKPLDWAVVIVYIVWVVYDGLRRSKGTDKVEGYFLANRSLPWWAVGLSVMATQMSAVTIVGTTG